jgi:hypothetical protein
MNLIKKIYYKNVKCSRYMSGVAQRVGRGIALLFHYRGTRRRWVVSSTPRPHFTPGKRPVSILQGGWVGPRTGLDGCGKSRPYRDWIPDRSARSQQQFRLRYPAHFKKALRIWIKEPRMPEEGRAPTHRKIISRNQFYASWNCRLTKIISFFFLIYNKAKWSNWNARNLWNFIFLKLGVRVVPFYCRPSSC